MRRRRSIHFVPGGNDKMLNKALGLPADSLILDLEDSVTPQHKEAVRAEVCDWLQATDFGKQERLVRINPIDSEWGRADLEAVLQHNPEGIHAQCAGMILNPEFAVAFGVRERATDLEVIAIENRMHGSEFEFYDLVAADLLQQGIYQQGCQQRTMDDEAGIALGVCDIVAIIMYSMTVEGECGISKQEHRVRRDGVAEIGLHGRRFGRCHSGVCRRLFSENKFILFTKRQAVLTRDLMCYADEGQLAAATLLHIDALDGGSSLDSFPGMQGLMKFKPTASPHPSR